MNDHQLAFQPTTPGQRLARYKSVLIVTALLALVPLIFRNSTYTIHTATMMIFWAYMATAWNIMGGYLGHFAMGNGIYMAIGGYITGALFKFGNVSPWFGIIIAALITCVISCLVALPCFRLRGTYYSLSTTALLFIFKTIITNNKKIFGIEFGGAMGLRVPYVGGFASMEFVGKAPYYFIMLGLLVILLITLISINFSKAGFYFAAIKTNQEAASAIGVNTTRYKLLAQFLCTFFPAMGGGFYMMFLMFLDPSRVMAYGFSIEILLYAIVGGLGTTWGPAVGAFILYPISEILRVKLGDAGSLSKAIYALIFMIVVFFLPKGLLPGIQGILEKAGVNAFFRKLFRVKNTEEMEGA